MKHLTTLFLSICILFSFVSYGENNPSPILFIYDASGSMWGQIDGKTKQEIASSVLIEVIEGLPDNQNIALIAYGHRKEGDCRDVEYLAQLSNTSKTLVTSAVKRITPLGKTPLAYSASLAINALKDSKTKGTILLITDGIESCDGDICEVVKLAKAEGIDFKLHIVGFGLKEDETKQLKCAAAAGDGHYYDAANASGLSEVLNEATSETIDESSGNFTVYTEKNGQPVDGLVQAYSADIKLVDGVRTYGDTAFLTLPAGIYTFRVSALENSRIQPITISNIQSYPDTINHKTISFDGGKINLITLNNEEGWDCTSKVIDADGKVVGGSRTYGRPKLIEVDPGEYSVEIAALKMSGIQTTYLFEKVKVESGKTVELSHSFKTGKALIGVKSREELIDAVVGISEKKTGKNVAGARSYTSASSNPREFTLNPGIYEVTVKPVKKEYARKMEKFTIQIKQGETIEKTSIF